MIQKAIPLLPAINISKTIDFYKYKLGFTSVNYGNYVMLHFKNVEIHFYYTKDKSLFVNSSCYLLVRNIEDLYGCFSSKEIINPDRQLEDKPWGTREFSIVDNNGNIIRFGEKK
jgi:hypothetical protein